jgi:hypothetical protein
LLLEGSSVFAKTAALYEDLGLEEAVVFARLALHVIDGVAILDVRIEPENHVAPGVMAALRDRRSPLLLPHLRAAACVIVHSLSPSAASLDSFNSR